MTTRAALASLKGGIPDVDFADILLPSLDVFTAHGSIRRDPGLEAAPVIPVTSPEQVKIAQGTKGGGTAAVVMKPATLKAIGLAIRSVGLL